MGNLIKRLGWPVRELLEIELAEELDLLLKERKIKSKKNLTSARKGASMLRLVSGSTKKQKRGQ